MASAGHADEEEPTTANEASERAGRRLTAFATQIFPEGKPRVPKRGGGQTTGHRKGKIRNSKWKESEGGRKEKSVRSRRKNQLGKGEKEGWNRTPSQKYTGTLAQVSKLPTEGRRGKKGSKQRNQMVLGHNGGQQKGTKKGVGGGGGKKRLLKMIKETQQVSRGRTSGQKEGPRK